jgi:hypothetical protein
MGHDLKGGKIYALNGEAAPATPKKAIAKKATGNGKSTSGSGEEDSDEKGSGPDSSPKRKVAAELGDGQEHKKPKVEDGED